MHSITGIFQRSHHKCRTVRTAILKNASWWLLLKVNLFWKHSCMAASQRQLQTYIHSRFVSSVCKNERQLDNQGKRGFHHNSRDSERKASQRRRKVYFTFKSLSIFQIFQSFSILTIVIVTIMADKINKKNIAENST